MKCGSNSSYILICFLIKMKVKCSAGDKKILLPSSSVGTTALLHVNPHTDCPQVNQFRHANLSPHVTDSCCIWSYADIRRECITSTLCIVQLHYANSLLLVLSRLDISTCVYLCVHVCLCAHGWRPGWHIYTHLHFILSFWICHKSTCRISCFCAACKNVCLWIYVFECNCSEHTRTFETITGDEGHQQCLKYWWLPLKTCMPYAKLLHLMNHSYSWLTILLFVPSNVIIVVSFRTQTRPSSGRIAVFLMDFFFFFCHSLSFSSPQCKDVHAAEGIFNEGSFG